MNMLKNEIKDLKYKKGMVAKDILTAFSKFGGFQASLLSEGADILGKMVEDKKCLRMLSFPACILATGARGAVTGLIKNNFFDIVITTCGSVDHDLARLWKPYYSGYFEADDIELHKKGVHRLGNVFVPQESYGIILEEKLQPMFETIWKDKLNRGELNRGENRIGSWEIIREVGRKIEKNDRRGESFIYWAYKNKIPVVLPGPLDGAFGFQLWMFYQKHRDLIIDPLRDEDILSEKVWKSKKLGGLVIGGGISKHHLIWWSQFGNGLDYGVYLTSAQEWDGSLSGARLKEGISWGKIKERAKQVTVQGDATILLPLLFLNLMEKKQALDKTKTG